LRVRAEVLSDPHILRQKKVADRFHHGQPPAHHLSAKPTFISLRHVQAMSSPDAGFARVSRDSSSDSIKIARSLFLCWLRSLSHTTAIPVGLCVILTPTDIPTCSPLVVANGQLSIRNSSGFIKTTSCAPD